MTDSTREQLLGYLLGVLDDVERKEVEERLNNDPALRKELMLMDRSLAPLDLIQSDFEVPPGLAERTCELVEFHARQPAAVQQREEEAARVIEAGPAINESSPMSESPKLTATSGFRWADLLTAAAIVVTAALLIIPAVQSRRMQSRLIACQNNLRQLGVAMTQYSQKHQNYFPPVPSRGRLAVAGIYAPLLLENGFLTDQNQVVCPESMLAKSGKYKIPTFAQLVDARSPAEFAGLRSTMGGSYGYCVGYMQDGKYRTTKNLRRTNFALMSDTPNGVRPDLQSVNHGGDGQNVLFEDGHVAFVTSSKPNEQADDFFTNDDGLVAAGRHKDDSVIGASDTSPSPPLTLD